MTLVYQKLKKLTTNLCKAKENTFNVKNPIAILSLNDVRLVKTFNFNFSRCLYYSKIYTHRLKQI